MPDFTFDTNCLIAIDEGRPEAAAIQTIVAAHRKGACTAAVVAITASENPRSGAPAITNFSEFRARLARLGVGDLEILKPMTIWDVAFWDWSLLASSEDQAFERRLHAILFPAAAFDFADYCKANAADPKAPLKWRNQKCDVQAIWSHIKHGRNVFVTSDRNFHSHKADLIALGAGAIEFPTDAAALI
jgi:hypothetical protein